MNWKREFRYDRRPGRAQYQQVSSNGQNGWSPETRFVVLWYFGSYRECWYDSNACVNPVDRRGPCTEVSSDYHVMWPQHQMIAIFLGWSWRTVQLRPQCWVNIEVLQGWNWLRQGFVAFFRDWTNGSYTVASASIVQKQSALQTAMGTWHRYSCAELQMYCFRMSPAWACPTMIALFLLDAPWSTHSYSMHC